MTRLRHRLPEPWPPLPRGYFAIGAERMSKALNLGNLMRSAHGFGASFTFTSAHLPGARSARRHVQGPIPPAALQLDLGRRLALPQGCKLVGVELIDARSTCRASGTRCAPPTCSARSRARSRKKLVGSAATMSCESPRAFASMSPWPARSSCTTGFAAWHGSPTGRWARVAARARDAARFRARGRFEEQGLKAFGCGDLGRARTWGRSWHTDR